MAWHEKASLAFTVVGSIGAALTAYATLRMLGITRRTTAVEGPALTDPTYARDTSGNNPTKVSLGVMDRDKSRWRIKRIITWPPLQPLISDIAARENPDGAGGMFAKIEPKKWVRSLAYDPPKESVGFLVSPDAPRRLRLFVTLASRADETITSRRATTIRAHD